MLKEETTVHGGNSGGNSWARACDTCRATACTVYCKADSAYLCSGCDERVHAANRVASRHERVCVCEACQRAPAAFICKADAASLCIACDADIHSANPLARRHQRLPIMPISGCLYGPRGGAASGVTTEDGEGRVCEEEEGETGSWLLLSHVKNSTTDNNCFLFGSSGGDVVDDEYLDLTEYNSNCCIDLNNNNNNNNNIYSDQNNNFVDLHHQKNCYGGDSVVPVESCGEVGKDQLTYHHRLQQKQECHNFQSGLEFDQSSQKPTCGYNGSISHRVSIASMDVGVAPDSTSEVSISHPRPPKGTTHLFSSPPIQMPTQLSPRDREAKVLRYRQKKKTRRFEKTIRYASRKAYAETRSRIKGRFAKRSTAVEDEFDDMFSAALMAETGYGIVPSF